VWRWSQLDGPIFDHILDDFVVIDDDRAFIGPDIGAAVPGPRIGLCRDSL
jgi:hypothetical protein